MDSRNRFNFITEKLFNVPNSVLGLEAFAFLGMIGYYAAPERPIDFVCILPIIIGAHLASNFYFKYIDYIKDINTPKNSNITFNLEGPSYDDRIDLINKLWRFQNKTRKK